jgi:hypothetical protein
MSKMKKYASRILIAIFGYIITPSALIHEFHGHEDTNCIHHNSASVGPRHVHCKMLQIEGKVYTSQDPVELAVIEGERFPWWILPPESPALARILYTDLRAPPEEQIS